MKIKRIFRAKLNILITVSILLSAFISTSLAAYAEIADESANFPAGAAKNLALGMKCFASSAEGSATSASRVNDGDSFTRWASKHTDNEWICIDMMKATTFNRIILNWDQAYGKEFKIQVSDDAKEWNDIYTTTAGHDYISDIDIDYTTGRYVRMLGIKRATEYGYSLYEFGIYYDEYSLKAMNHKSDKILWKGYAHTYLDCVNIGKKYVALERDSVIRVTDNITDWKTVRLGKIIRVTAVGNRFVAISASGNLFYSADGYSWKSSSCNLQGRVRTIHRANGVVFLYMWDKSIFYTKDGTLWEKLKLDMGKKTFCNVTYRNGLYEIACNTFIRLDRDTSEAKAITRWVYGNYIYQSADLIKWNEAYLGETDFDNSKIAPVGISDNISADELISISNEDAKIIYGSCEDLGFSNITRKENILIASFTLLPNLNYVSVDGFKWVQRDFSIAYNAEKFLSNFGESGFMESQDGLHWNKINTPQSLDIFKVYSCGKVFIGEALNRIYVSKDGYVWDMDRHNIRRVVSGGHDGILAVNLDNELLYSNDGYNWVTVENSYLNSYPRTDYSIMEAVIKGNNITLLVMTYKNPRKYTILMLKDIRQWHQLDFYEYDSANRISLGMNIGENVWLKVYNESENGILVENRVLIGTLKL